MWRLLFEQLHQARNAEKAMTALARFRQAQLEEGKVRERRPFLASECSELPKAEKWRRQIISEISKKVAQIQNAGLGEFRIRDLNDEINKLLREKGHWEVRIKELGGPDYARFGPRMLDHEGKEVPGNRGYKYFGAARDLPGVRELFEKEPAPALRRTRAELMKEVDAEYYGYRDEDDGVLLPLEAQHEKQVVVEAVQKWKTEKESRLAGEKLPEEEEEEENIYTIHKDEAGVLFDVDGVLLRGGAVIPAARRAFRKLLDQNNNFLFPVVFVTNAGSCQRHHKAQQLSHLLEVQIAPEQVVLSHSPLQMLKGFHDKCVLVSGQGPVTDIANTLGFQNVVTIEQLRDHHHLLDMVDHNRRPKLPSTHLQTLPKIEAIILFGEPVRWETNLQLLIDVLLTNGSPGYEYDAHLSTQLPVLACNMDLMWMAEAPSPRFGHGMFLLCLESVYRKLTGRELQYQALLGKPSLLTYQYAEHLLRLQNNNHRITTIYAIGDNLMTDIYGANLYNRYLAQQHAAMATSTKFVAQGTVSQVTMAVPEEELVSTAAQCHSLLVCTGVYNPRFPLPTTITETVFDGHRDLVLEPDLVQPSHVVADVEAAVDLLLQEEGYVIPEH
ncbi:putative cat eye syndrome critical region protein 5-like [Scophthalmus maximus]|uniref:Haloacid dehalogenase-like hydrolase domain-containing 5 n=1 Tax=Scophthalmus maximus TaxID=52904 RepID=A0A2U9BF68_SCOMX|nr:putative cat eye syndrome critical region protein 5-like [Scophthalmus maximus]